MANVPETRITVLLGMGIVPEKVHTLLCFTRNFNSACELFSFIFFIFLFLVGIYNSKAKNINKKTWDTFQKQVQSFTLLLVFSKTQSLGEGVGTVPVQLLQVKKKIGAHNEVP